MFSGSDEVEKVADLRQPLVADAQITAMKLSGQEELCDVESVSEGGLGTFSSTTPREKKGGRLAIE